MLLLELLDAVLHDPLVKVLSAEVCIASGGLDLENSVVNGKKGHVKCAPAQVKHKDVFFGLLGAVQAIGNGRCSGLVEHALHLQTCDRASVLGGLPLCVVEIRGHRNNRVGHCFAQKSFGRLLHLPKNHGRYLLRRVRLGL